MNGKIDAYAAYGLFFFLMTLFGLIILQFPVAYIWATYEDLPGEWCQFYFFVITLFFAVLLARSRARSRFFFAALALACFYVAGEEISWGQRLFNIPTPDFFRAHNLQQETNLHNFFTGPYSTLLKQVIEAALACAFIIYGVIYPRELRIGRPAAVWINDLGIPAPPLHLWPFFATAALCELRIFSFNEAEIAEILLALALAMLAGHHWLLHSRQGKSADSFRRRQAALLLLIFFSGTGLAAATSSLCYRVPRLQAEMDAKIISGMEKFAERYGRYGSWENAAGLYRQLLGKKPKSAALLRGLARCYQQLGDSDKFEATSRQAIALDMTRYGRYPADIAVNLSLYKSFLQAGLNEQADLHLHKALQAGLSKVNLEPENAAAVYWLGKSYLAAGDTDQARKLLQKAVLLQPRSTVYQKELYRLTLEQRNGPGPADLEAEG